MKRRKVTDAERSLWDLAVKKTERLKPPLASYAELPKAPQIRMPLNPQRPQKLPSFKVGERSQKPAPSHHLQPDLDARFAKVSPNMDKRNFDRLKKGKLRVDGRIDLHGMTLAQAHPALNGFVRDAHGSGKRLLLVITGKGNKERDDNWAMPARRGVLRHQVPQWLAMAPLAPLVLQVTQASLKHGGTGAYYVYLRRSR